MTDKKRNRRKFIADLLFAGGALTGAAFISKYAGGDSPSPVDPPVKTPMPAGTPAAVDPKNCGIDQPLPGEAMIDGDVEMPEPQIPDGAAVQPSPAPRDPFQSPPDNAPVPLDRPLPGRVAMPRENCHE